MKFEENQPRDFREVIQRYGILDIRPTKFDCKLTFDFLPDLSQKVQDELLWSLALCLSWSVRTFEWLLL